ncbi:MAG: septum site-determining protein MinC [Methylocystaceae bacterium]
MVDIKGQNNNLVLNFSRGKLEEYIQDLEQKFAANPRFFIGMQVVFRGEGLKKMSVDEIASLQRLCLDYGMVMQNTVRVKEAAPYHSAGKDMVIKTTLRSGQKVHSEGSIVIVGNVNESAEVVAGHDIIVLGKLEGIAHAGCYGDLTRTVFALDLFPRQIRIGDQVSCLSSDFDRCLAPEMAYWDGSSIAIKAMGKRKNSRWPRWHK